MSLLTLLVGRKNTQEEIAKYHAQLNGLNSKEYRDLQGQKQADNEINKIIKKVLYIKEIKRNDFDKYKLLGDKFSKKQKENNTGYLVYLDHKEKQRGGLNNESVESFKKGNTGSKTGNFNKGLIYEILKEEEIYNGFMSSRTKEEFERNHQKGKDGRYEPNEYKKNQIKEQDKTEKEKEKDFNYLKFLKEQVYTPLLIEKQDKYGIYNGIPEKVCHPERFETKKTVNDDVDKQLELLKQQQAILDRQIELEKLKDRNNSDRG